MKIAVVGSGAIGGLLGAFLCKSGEQVTFVDIWQEHVEEMKGKGLTIVRDNGDDAIKVIATTDIEEAGNPDLIIMAVKSYDNAQAARDCLRIVGPDTTVLTVQNGVGNVDSIGTVLGRERIIAGTCSFGCTVLGPGRIKPTPVGSLSIGELDGRITPRLEHLTTALNKAGIEVHLCQNVDSLIWTKLMVNVGINAITAITGLANGQLLEYEETRSLQQKVVDEGAQVAREKGIKLLVEDPLKYVMDIAESTYNNKSSMLQDIERGARTEVDFINGAIVKEGKILNVSTPVNEALTSLIRTIEKHSSVGKADRHKVI